MQTTNRPQIEFLQFCDFLVVAKKKRNVHSFPREHGKLKNCRNCICGVFVVCICGLFVVYMWSICGIHVVCTCLVRRPTAFRRIGSACSCFGAHVCTPCQVPALAPNPGRRRAKHQKHTVPKEHSSSSLLLCAVEVRGGLRRKSRVRTSACSHRHMCCLFSPLLPPACSQYVRARCCAVAIGARPEVYVATGAVESSCP